MIVPAKFSLPSVFSASQLRIETVAVGSFAGIDNALLLLSEFAPDGHPASVNATWA
jgi:hypothetical protein